MCSIAYEKSTQQLVNILYMVAYFVAEAHCSQSLHLATIWG